MKMFSFLFIIIPLLSQYQVLSSTVLLWSNSNLPQTAVPLSKQSSLDVISNHICQINSKQIQLRLFAVNQLTNEDLQRGSQSQHSILIDAKKDNSRYRYFPNVDDEIYQTFSLIPQSNNMQCSQIHFDISSSNIYETLHDALNAMQTSVDSIGTDSDKVIVMALITGPIVVQNLPRQRRSYEVFDEDVIVSDDNGSCIFYAKGLEWENGAEKSSNLTLDYDRSSCSVEKNATKPTVILTLFWSNGTTDPIEMIFTTSIVGRYWYLDSVVVNDTHYRYFAYGMQSKMDTPPGYSYACTTAQFIKYRPDEPKGRGSYDFTSKFYIKHFQFQPFNTSDVKFGPPNYCTSFFTSGIWMGITSSLLCLGILLVGVHRMMSIKSNDRFDDPKGKPLIIKAQE